MIKAMQQETFMIFTEFLLTVKVFPTNFITIIWSTNVYAKIVVVLVKSKIFPHIMIKSNELQNFLPRNFDC